MSKKEWLAIALLGAALLLSGCGKAQRFYEKGMDAAAAGEYEKAESSLKKALKENDERAEYYIGYGMVLNELGRYEAAIKQFERARQDVSTSIANANNKQVYYGEAMSYYQLGDIQKALELCKKAAALREPAALDGKLYCSQGVLQELIGEEEEALKSYQKAVKKDSKNWQAYYRISVLYSRKGDRDSAGQAKALIEAAYGDGEAEAGYYLAELAGAESDMENAKKYLEAYVSEEKGEKLSDAYDELAEYAIEDEDWALAEKYVQAGKKKADGLSRQKLWIKEIILAERQGAFDQARSVAQEYLKEYPEDKKVKKEVQFLETRTG